MMMRGLRRFNDAFLRGEKERLWWSLICWDDDGGRWLCLEGYEDGLGVWVWVWVEAGVDVMVGRVNWNSCMPVHVINIVLFFYDNFTCH